MNTIRLTLKLWRSWCVLLALGLTTQSAAAQQTLRVSASAQMTPMLNDLATAFQLRHSDVTIEVTTQNSAEAIAALRGGQTHIAAMSRPPTREELRLFHQVDKKQLWGTPIAMGAVVMIVRPDNPLQSMTVQQAMNVSLQHTYDWSKLDVILDGSVVHEHSPSCRHPYQKGAPIHLIIPQDGRDTLEFIRRMTRIPHHFRRDLPRLADDEQIAHAVSFDANAIGLVSWASYDGVRIVAIRTDSQPTGVLPTYDSIQERAYPLAHYFYLYSSGHPSDYTKVFITYATGQEGQQVIKQVGGVPLPMQTTEGKS